MDNPVVRFFTADHYGSANPMEAQAVGHWQPAPVIPVEGNEVVLTQRVPSPVEEDDDWGPEMVDQRTIYVVKKCRIEHVNARTGNYWVVSCLVEPI